MGSFFVLVEIGGVREWAAIGGSEGTLEVRGFLAEAGLDELVAALDDWINAIPSGLQQIDSDFIKSTYAPEVQRADDQLYRLIMREGNAHAARYLAWHSAQS